MYTPSYSPPVMRPSPLPLARFILLHFSEHFAGSFLVCAITPGGSELLAATSPLVPPHPQPQPHDVMGNCRDRVAPGQAPLLLCVLELVI